MRHVEGVLQVEGDLEGGLDHPMSPSSTQPTVQDETRSQSYFAWYDVRCSYSRPWRTLCDGSRRSSKGRGLVHVLHGVSGYLRQGQMVAVLGPSGSGKTCLLDILAGRKSVGQLSGSRVLNGDEVGSAAMRSLSAYMPQEDVFHPQCTLQEALRFHADLRLDPKMASCEKAALVLRLLESVGLKGKEDQYVGGPLPGGLQVRGLSGGEKRRLSLCCATITDPSILFLDEPTSGLDSLSALAVMRLVKRYFSEGKRMGVCTIHQPRSQIWGLFDKVMVLSEGHLIYFGDVSGVESWFVSRLNYPRPASTSVSDYILDLVNVGFVKRDLITERTINSRAELQAAAKAFQHSSAYKLNIPDVRVISSPSKGGEGSCLHDDNSSVTLQSASTQSTAASLLAPQSAWEKAQLWPLQFRVVLGRAFRTFIRHPGNALVRPLLYITLASFQGFLFYGTGSRKAVLTGPAINIMGSLFSTLACVALLPILSMSLFIYDRQFFAAERASRLYPASAYFLANMLLEVVLASINGVLFGTMSYLMLDYPAFTHPSNVAWNFVQYLCVVVLQTNVGNIIAIFSALFAPNQDVALGFATGFNSLSFMSGGFLVPFPQFFPYARWLQWVSHFKYFLQAGVMVLIGGTPDDGIIDTLEFYHPSTVGGNLACAVALYFVLFSLAYASLRFLHKERR